MVAHVSNRSDYLKDTQIYLIDFPIYREYKNVLRRGKCRGEKEKRQDLEKLIDKFNDFSARYSTAGKEKICILGRNIFIYGETEIACSGTYL